MSSLLEESFEPPLPTPTPTPQQPAPPVPSYCVRRVAAGVETELLVQTYSDRVMVVVSQNGKVGCLTQAALPPVHPLLAPPPAASAGEGASPALAALPPPPASIALTALLGSAPDTTLHDVYVSQIATLIWWSLQLAHSPRRPVVVGLSLKRNKSTEEDDPADAERERFGGIMDMVASWPGPQ